MVLSIKGYVLEGVRVGAANSPFTAMPDVLGEATPAFTQAYPSDESAPRTDYLVLLTSDGGTLVSSRFGWTKNELIDRFAYASTAGAFKLLPGAAPTVVGLLSTDSNTQRLKVRAPTASVSQVPCRLTVGGHSIAVNPVAADTDLTTTPLPTAGNARISLATGNIQWSGADLQAYAGQVVLWQQQQFFDPKESSGRLGEAPLDESEPALYLNPIPGTGQYPRLRFGFGRYLRVTEVATDTALTGNTEGTIQWSRATGKLKISTADASSNVGKPLYYDGVLLALDLPLPRQSLGAIASPVSLTVLPDQAGDLIFTASGGYQFPKVQYTTQAFTSGTRGTVQVHSTSGAVGVSTADKQRFAGQTLTATYGDLPIERGISLRLFRTPANLDASRTDAKDVTGLYSVTGAVLADPIVASPQVLLPSIPVDDPAYPLTVRVLAGKGSYTSNNFPALDQTGADAGLGYYIDFEAGSLYFAQRKVNLSIAVSIGSTDIVLPDPLILAASASFKLGSEWLTQGDNVVLDATSGILSFTQSMPAVLSGSSGSFSGVTFSDPKAHFTEVEPGAVLVIVDGSEETVQGVFVVEAVPSDTSIILDCPNPAGVSTGLSWVVRSGYEVLADRYFDEVEVIDPSIQVQRILGGVTKDLKVGDDYLLAPQLGLVQFTERLLESERAHITYKSGGQSYSEFAGFLVRKEVTQAHPEPTTTLFFNSQGVPLAESPAPQVFRGGRPQKLGVQCTVDTAASSITFLPDAQLTDALPHGAIIGPNERVYIDYYVSEALGGEKTFTVTHVPIDTVDLVLSDDDEDHAVDSQGYPLNPCSTRFMVPGDRRADFPEGFLLRVEKEAVFMLAAPQYSPVQDRTIVNLAGGVIAEALTNPKLYVSSGYVGTEYFLVEPDAPYEPVSRGSNTIYLTGDKSAAYLPGVVVGFARAGGNDYLQVTGSQYEAEKGRTKVMLASTTPNQYLVNDLLRSVRPVFEQGLAAVRTQRVPVLTEPILIYRRSEGSPGHILSSPADYTIDDSGSVAFTVPLGPREYWGVVYTGRQGVTAGTTLLASYTAAITPNAQNGLLGQTLVADYTVSSPDTFYFRVETMTNFRGEFQKELSSAGSSGTSGPQTSNTSQPKLYEQGTKSLYFDERHYANQDTIAKATLKYFNDQVNAIEGALRSLDGRVVGNSDGLLLIDSAMKAGDPLVNQIDDLIKVSDAPYTISGPPFVRTSVGTFKRYYQPSPVSRFYPTRKSFFGAVIAPPATTQTGDEVLDTGATNITQVTNLRTRLAWAVVTEAASAGAGVLKVDAGLGQSAYLRPPFRSGMKCLVQKPDGTFVQDAAHLVTVVSAAAQQLTVSGVISSIAAGCTIYRSPIDDSIQTADPLLSYVQGRDYGYNGESGQLTYVASNDSNKPLVHQQALSGQLNLVNTLTAPVKFPALYGGLCDDDGEMSLPVQTDTKREVDGYLAAESALIPVIVAATVPPFIGTGSNTNTSTSSTITNAGGSFPSPLPQLRDLVRVRTGALAASPITFYRVIGFTANTVTVAPALPGTASGFEYEIGVGTARTARNCGVGSTTTLLVDTGGAFLTTAAPGQTVLFPNGVRRQITSVSSNTSLTFTPALASAPTTTDTYRVSDSLVSYGNIGTDAVSQLSTILASEVSLYTARLASIDAFLGDGQPLGIAAATVTALQSLRSTVSALLSDVTSFRMLLLGQIAASDASAYVNLLTGADLTARANKLTARLGAAGTSADIETLENILKGSDQLYDQRYTWISARIDLQDGLLVKQANAVANRVKAQAQAAAQMMKLLAT